LTSCLNDRLHAVSVGKPSERMSNFWMVRFLKTEFEPNFGFPHSHTADHKCRDNVQVRYGDVLMRINLNESKLLWLVVCAEEINDTRC